MNCAQNRIPRSYSPGVLPGRRIALAAVVAVACSDSPAAPSPTTPSPTTTYAQLGGTYSGQVFLTVEGFNEPLGTIIAIVEQAGNRVTITVSMTGLINRTLPSIRGTTGRGGGFAIDAGDAGGPPFRYPDCGLIQPVRLIIAFGADEMVYVEFATTQTCGELEVIALLTRQ